MFKNIFKTTFIFLLFIIAIIIIAIIFAVFLAPQETIRYGHCILLQNPDSGEVECFGCANGVCKDAPINWLLYQRPAVGIPYSCQETPQGCQLVQ